MNCSGTSELHHHLYNSKHISRGTYHISRPRTNDTHFRPAISRNVRIRLKDQRGLVQDRRELSLFIRRGAPRPPEKLTGRQGNEEWKFTIKLLNLHARRRMGPSLARVRQIERLGENEMRSVFLLLGAAAAASAAPVRGHQVPENARTSRRRRKCFDPPIRRLLVFNSGVFTESSRVDITEAPVRCGNAKRGKNSSRCGIEGVVSWIN